MGWQVYAKVNGQWVALGPQRSEAEAKAYVERLKDSPIYREPHATRV